MKGTVKFFKRTKGWGFIRGEDEKDYFVHQSDIQMKGFRNLADGDQVEFDVMDSPKGKQAIHVKPILTFDMVRTWLCKQNLHLESVTDNTWRIVDENNQTVAGRRGYGLEELANYLQNGEKKEQC